MAEHLTRGAWALPVLMILDADFVERAWWDRVRTSSKRWVTSLGRELAKKARYREIRCWYARNRGQTMLAELAAANQSADVARAA